MDKQTRQIIAFHVGDRSRDSAKQLWQNIPEVYQEQGMFYTDQYVAYLGWVRLHMPIFSYGSHWLQQEVSRNPLVYY
jgi:IS1 family transposase